MQKDASSFVPSARESGVGLVFRHFSKKGQIIKISRGAASPGVVRTLDGFLDEVDVEVPGSWSQNATDTPHRSTFVVGGAVSDGERGFFRSSPSSSAPCAEVGLETSLKHVVPSMAGCWAYWGRKSGL